jgi:L-aspartate oxidase
MSMERTDYIVIGSGIAGLRAAIELAKQGNVLVLTKSKADESNTEYAQGGIAVAMSDEDRIGLHYEDTIRAGDGLCKESAVRVLVEEGPRRITELIAWGTQFDRAGLKLAFSREAAHSRRRILHAQGDGTGREINRTLLKKVQSLDSVTLRPYCLAVELLFSDSSCEGVRFLNEANARLETACAGALLLATGGVGMVYCDTTNPDIATGDGYALGLLAGAALTDMELVQFHPTALKIEGAPRYLLSEAMRGEGGRLTDSEGRPFMQDYHPLGDLAPRDVVSRAIWTEARRLGVDRVYLDLTHLEPEFVRRRFPGIYRNCLNFGFDISRQRIPVFPAAHYMMGGVYTDLHGATTVPGLYAAGEVACNGVHGANRLASNSLLEGLVYGARAGEAMAKERNAPGLRSAEPLGEEPAGGMEPVNAAPERDTVRTVLTQEVGIVRSGEGLERAVGLLRTMSPAQGRSRKEIEFNSLLMAGRLAACCALLRQESRGGHYRSDYPQKDDQRWKKRVLTRYDLSSKRFVHATIGVDE